MTVGGLILTVGDTPEPVEFSLRQAAPAYACFLCTPQSRIHLDRIVTAAGLPPSRYQVFEVDDRPSEAARLAHHVIEAHRWLLARGLRSDQIAVDATGGRKWMSSAATLMAGALGLPMSYVEVKYSEGRPDPTTMQVVSLANVVAETGIVEAGRAVSLFNAGEFAAADKVFTRMSRRVADADLRDLTGGLAELSNILERWDRFLHLREPLSGPLAEVRARMERSRSLADASGPLLERLTHLSRAAEALFHGFRPTILADLVANGRRCQQRGRYDDAVARAYRALEATAQWILNETRGLETGAVRNSGKNLKPATLDALRQRHAGQLPNKIGLEEAWWVLAMEGHPVAVNLGSQDKGEWRLQPRLEGLLKARNQSILAHGFDAVGGDTAKKLLDAVEEALRLAVGEDRYDDLRNQVTFPELPSLPGGEPPEVG